ncbi:D-Ala-D-Ala carboxypeptidase family metallohydrolase [Notoacmeibacter ruber]|uniref:Murein endopeptidase K n=1 Tax=Notoacmeibacter ruber TaxID=2670375 RepID=A0A3L7JB83_9HYPH|nr:D-Ala-D-Ala carboxypeptidase family metallohydrolase [Notoacmeibacter ruber]RLQ87997.1 DUF882 domain-containing protein [Notoacmeibacter ruber]
MRQAALLLLSATSLSLAACTSGTPVPPLGLALAEVAESQDTDATTSYSTDAGDLIEQGDGGDESEDTTLALAADETSAAENGPAVGPEALSANLLAPPSGSATPPPPIKLAAATPQAEANRVGAVTASQSLATKASADIPTPIRLPDNAIPRAKGQGEIALALAEPPQPIQLDRSIAARPSAPPSPVSSVAALPQDALPGVNKDRLFEIERRDGQTDNSDIDLDERSEPVEVASLSGLARLAPNGLRKQHDDVDVNCLKPSLVRVLNQVESKFGRPVVVTSGYRSPQRNQRASGAKKSLHMFCAAADIQVEGVSKWTLAEYLRSMPGRGGVGTYCHTKSVHIDVGPERDWNWRCKRRRRR